MSIGSWMPENETKPSIDRAFLLRCIDHIDNDRATNLREAMTEGDQAQSSLMHCDQSVWDPSLANLDEDQLVSLIRFFTLVEMQLPGWEAGTDSPVIAINRHLKSRGVQLDKSVLLWIRESSTNRFIPNGPIAF